MSPSALGAVCIQSWPLTLVTGGWLPAPDMSTTATTFLSSLRTSASSLEPCPNPRWRVSEVRALRELPFIDTLFGAQHVYRAHVDSSEAQISTLLSIKTGGCAEECDCCPQSAHFAGTNSIFYGDELLITSNPQAERNCAFFKRPGLKTRGRP